VEDDPEAPFVVPPVRTAASTTADDYDDHDRADEQADALSASQACDPSSKSGACAPSFVASAVPSVSLIHCSLFGGSLRTLFTLANVPETGREMGGCP